MTYLGCSLCLQTHGSSAQHQCTLKVLSLMIERVTAFPELAREVGTTKIKVLLPAVLSLTSRSKVRQLLFYVWFRVLFFGGGGGQGGIREKHLSASMKNNVCCITVHFEFCFAFSLGEGISLFPCTSPFCKRS